MTTYQANDKRIAKNTVFLYIRMFFVLLANLYISRILLDTLDIVDYGIYMVVAGLMSLFGFFSATLASTPQHYYNYEDTHKWEQGIQDIFAIDCIINLLVAALILVLLESIGLWYPNHYLVVPVDRIEAAVVLFHAPTLSLVLITPRIPTTELTLAKEGMEFYTAGSMTDVSLRIAAAMALPCIGDEHISVCAYLLLRIAILSFSLYHGCTKLSSYYIHLSRKTNRQTAHSLLAFTGWDMTGTLAFMLRGQGISLLLNSSFDPIVNTTHGISMQISSAVRQFSANIMLAFSPQIISAIAEENEKPAISMMFTESEICFAAIPILICPLCPEINYILELWLGANVPTNFEACSILLLIDALICTLSTPYTQITQATGKLESYRIDDALANLCLIPSCYISLRLDFSSISSFVITIIFSVISQCVYLYFAHKVVNFNFCLYLKKVLCPCVILACIIPLTLLFAIWNVDGSFARLLFVCFLDVVVAIPTCYYLLLTKKEQAMLRAYFEE